MWRALVGIVRAAVARAWVYVVAEAIVHVAWSILSRLFAPLREKLSST